MLHVPWGSLYDCFPNACCSVCPVGAAQSPLEIWIGLGLYNLNKEWGGKTTEEDRGNKGWTGGGGRGKCCGMFLKFIDSRNISVKELSQQPSGNRWDLRRKLKGEMAPSTHTFSLQNFWVYLWQQFIQVKFMQYIMECVCVSFLINSGFLHLHSFQNW